MSAVEAHDPATLNYVAPKDIADWWPLFSHLVPSILERSRGRLTLETFAESIAKGETHLFAVWDGREVLTIVGLDVSLAPSGLRVGTIRFASGKDSPRWLHLIDEMEDNAREVGCEVLEIIARKGWERKLPSYKLTHVFLEKDLRNAIT
jgi:hypothetical protein